MGDADSSLAAGAAQPSITPTPAWCAALDARIGARWDALWDMLPSALDPNDQEGVHAVRVASRRLRAALSAGRVCHSGKGYARLRRTARKITRALGAVRDLQTQQTLLAAELATAAPLERDALASMAKRLAREERTARRDLERTLRRVRRSGIPKKTRRRFPASDRAMPDETDAALAPARRILADRIRAVAAYAPVATRPHSSTQLHALRIEVKRLRYTLELFADDFGPIVDERLAHLKLLQDALGDAHDQDVLIARLRDELARVTRKRRKAGSAKAAAEAARTWGLALALAHARDERRARYAAVANAWEQSADWLTVPPRMP